MLQLLGEGGESRVFAYGDRYVLRVFRGPSDGAGARRDLVESFDRSAAPFMVPRTVVAGPGWAIDERVPGRSLDWWMWRIDGAARVEALRAYALAARHVVHLAGPYDFFGELCGPLRTPSWPEYLRRKVDTVLSLSGEWLRADVAGLEEVVDRFRGDCDLVADVDVPRLVHGDYFPGNVVTGEDLTITGVIDFGTLSLAGDPRMDLAGALYFVDCVDAFQTSDAAVVAEVVRPLADAAVLDLYRRYYALFFSFTKPNDPELYAWCVRHLASKP